jgi:hypothetical protein
MERRGGLKKKRRERKKEEEEYVPTSCVSLHRKSFNENEPKK